MHLSALRLLSTQCLSLPSTQTFYRAIRGRDLYTVNGDRLTETTVLDWIHFHCSS